MHRQMHRPALVRFALGIGVLMVVILALAACGSGSAQEEPKARPLPLYRHDLRPGEYHSVKFKPPLSFKVGKGWENAEEQLSDTIDMGLQGCGPPTGDLTCKLHFANVKEVFKPGTTNVVEAPKDLVGWLQHHPYLKTSKPQPVTVGGVKGEQFEVLVDHLPKDPNGYCGSDCLDIFSLYPKTATLSKIWAQASCTRASQFSAFFDQRVRRLRRLTSHEIVRSTIQRLAG